MIYKPTRREFIAYAGASGTAFGQFVGNSKHRNPGTIAPGGITIHNHLLGPASSGTTTPSIDTSTADGLYIWGCGLNSGITVSDSKGNTWVASTNFSNGTNNATLWYADNGTGSLTVGAGHTFTISAGGFFAWGIIAAHGMKTSSSFDGSQGGTASASTTVSSGALNPGAGRHLIMGVMSAATTSGSWSSVSLGFTVEDQRGFTGGTNFDGGVCFLIQSAGASVNPAATFNTTFASAVLGLFSFSGV